MLEKIRTCIRKYINEKYYVLGFVEKDFVNKDKATELFNHIKWLDTGRYTSGWFADPFFLSANDEEIVLLAEEKVYAQNKGRIVKLTIEAKRFKLLSVHPVLELDTHLSFPYVIREGGKIYVFPENRKSGEQSLYEYDLETDKLINRKVLIQEPLVDSQLLKIDGHFFIFGVCQDGDKQFDAKLRVYESHNLYGPYKQIQEIISATKTQRGAGSILEIEGEIIRPSQNCIVSYGGSVIINQLKYEGGQFSESVLFEISPDKTLPNGLGLHTLNEMGNLCVVDGKDYKHKRLVNLIRIFKIRWKKAKKSWYGLVR